jgi:23S rRNA pseudouridine1911/1915/1917 synthase
MEWKVPEALAGARLDKAVVALAQGVSRARVKRAIDAGKIRVDGRRRPKGALVAAGEVVSLVDEDDALSGETPCAPTPGAPLTVRLERADLLVVDKPAGQATSPLEPRETGTLANALVGRYPELAGVGYGPREPGLVHRLDTGTSGLVVVARSSRVFDVLRAALRDGRLTKTYLVVASPRTEDDVLPDRGTIEYPLANHPKDQRRVLACIHPRDLIRLAPRPARTEYEVLRRAGRRVLVRASAPRALRHQIRVHFASVGFPLVGDVLYGGEAVEGFERHALHAAEVAFGGGDGVPAFRAESLLPAAIEALLGT